MRNLVVLFLASVAFLVGQRMDLEVGQPDTRNLYGRLKASERVIVGSVTGLTILHRRDYEVPKLHPGGPVVSALDNYPAFLDTVTIESELCRQSDFQVSGRETPSADTTVTLFIPRGGVSPASRGYETESLFKGAKYLLFLVKDPQRDSILANYELDPQGVYYRAEEGSHGAFEISAPPERGSQNDKVAALVASVTAFCNAVKPADTGQKIQELQKLRFHVDAGVRSAAEEAIGALSRGAK